MRGAIELPDGELLLPLANAPDYDSVFLLRSHDGGESWSGPTLVAAESGKEFEEPAGLLLGERRILLMLRENRSRVLHRSVSDDGGRRWSRPVATGIRDYPAQLLHLDEGRIACVAGRRTAPFGILLYLSQDGGMSWDLDRPNVVRDDLANADLGYPTRGTATPWRARCGVLCPGSGGRHGSSRHHPDRGPDPEHMRNA